MTLQVIRLKTPVCLEQRRTDPDRKRISEELWIQEVCLEQVHLEILPEPLFHLLLQMPGRDNLYLLVILGLCFGGDFPASSYRLPICHLPLPFQ